MISKKSVFSLALTAVAVAAFVLVDKPAVAQSGNRGAVPKQKESFESRLWTYLGSVCYQQWAPAGDEGDFRASEAPHGALVKTYMNRKAAGSLSGDAPKPMPNGSMVIKENYSPDKKLMAITVMVKSEGFNPDAGDWYWAKYMPDGKVAQMDTPNGKMSIAGKAKGCIECHGGADGDDYLFFND